MWTSQIGKAYIFRRNNKYASETGFDFRFHFSAAYDSNIVEYVSEYEYEYELYDDTGMTFEELETATEPMRNPEMRPAWKEYEE